MNKYRIFCFFLALFGASIISGCTFSSGHDTYEECVLAEMKGRDIDQQVLVEETCRSKFPLLKEFMETSKTGTLTCTWQKGNQTPFEVLIDKDSVSSYLGTFDIMIRNDHSIHAKSESYTLDGKWEEGAALNIYFGNAIGYISDINNELDQFLFSCQNVPLHKPSS